MTPSSFGRWTAAAAVMILATGTVLAGSPPITATWKGQADDPNGNSYPIQVALSQKGTQLTGGVTTPAGSFPLTGTISGTTFSFRTRFNGAPVTFHGTISDSGPPTVTLFPPATLGVGQFDQGLFDPRLTFTPESPPLPYDAANGVASGPPLPLRRDDATPATDQAAPAAGDGNGGD